MTEFSLVAAMCLLVSVADAAADAIARRWLLHVHRRLQYLAAILQIDLSAEFWRWNKWQRIWHLLKWFRFYVPLGAAIWLSGMPWEIALFTALWSLVFWRVTYIVVLQRGKGL